MITRIAYSDKINQGKFAALIEQAERLGMVRSEAWHILDHWRISNDTV